MARALEGAEEMLIVEPSTVKLDLISWLHARERALTSRVVSVETVDHRTDGELIACAKNHFKWTDAMRPRSAT